MPRIVHYRPVKTNKLTQHFAENGVCARCRPGGFPIIPYILIDKPAAGTCPQGYKDYYRLIGMLGHNGTDWATWYTEPFYHSSLWSGWQHIEYSKDGALNVDVVSLVPMRACTEGCPAGTIHYIKRRYTHGAKHVGFEKKPVAPGQQIGLAGKSGGVTATHVHASSKWCDEHGADIHIDNKFNGAFDDSADLVNEFILDHLSAAVLPVNIQNPAVVPPPKPAQIDTLQSLYKALFQASLFLDTLMHRTA